MIKAQMAIGVVFWLVAICVGLYVGVYVCLYGGIVQAVNGFSADPVNVSSGVFGVIRALFFELGGILAAVIPATIGSILLSDDL